MDLYICIDTQDIDTLRCSHMRERKASYQTAMT